MLLAHPRALDSLVRWLALLRTSSSYSAPLLLSLGYLQPEVQGREKESLLDRFAHGLLTATFLHSGVAIGSSVGHAIGGFFGGGGSSEAANPQAAAPAEQQQSNYYANQQQDPNCAMATKSFTNCMDEHSGNMSICGWYMDQLKACQTAASKY